MTKDQYVILTGNLNNSGDFLIGHRLIKLLEKFKPDRKIIEYDMWKAVDKEQLNEINNSKALIIGGGPGLVENIANIHPIVENWEDIKVPVITFGLGQHNLNTNFENFDINFKAENLDLIKKINNSGHISSVRDWESLNVLTRHGFKNFSMTGCPALYDLENITKEITPVKKDEIKNVVFSLGVTFSENKALDNLQKKIILKLKEYFLNTNFTIAFHHSSNEENFMNSYNALNSHFYAMQNMKTWLDKNQINYTDISCGCDKMIKLYSDCDLHIGYRVHAHILMTSMRKLSILIAEDGRGTALQDVIGGRIFKSHWTEKITIKRFPFKQKSKKEIVLNSKLPEELINYIDYELNNNCSRIINTYNLNKNGVLYKNMLEFIKQLP